MRETPIENWIQEGLAKAEAGEPPYRIVTHILLGKADLVALFRERFPTGDVHAFIGGMITGGESLTVNDVTVIYANVMAPTYLVDVTAK
jgi:hypothetical protein